MQLTVKIKDILIAKTSKNLLQIIAEYKIDREDAIMAVLYLLTEPELELEAKNTITIFPQEKIRETFTSENFLPPQGKEKEEIVRQKLTDIFGKSFFAEKE